MSWDDVAETNPYFQRPSSQMQRELKEPPMDAEAQSFDVYECSKHGNFNVAVEWSQHATSWKCPCNDNRILSLIGKLLTGQPLLTKCGRKAVLV